MAGVLRVTLVSVSNSGGSGATRNKLQISNFLNCSITSTDCPPKKITIRLSAWLLNYIDHMHMTSQKGAQLRWGSNETLPRASSRSMQPGGQPLHATPVPPGWPARARALRGWVPMRTASTTRARCATLDWRRCYGDVTLCDVNA